MGTLLQDFRFGLRLLARAPGFTAVALGALAIGIAANTTIFSVVDTLLLRPLPYADADRLGLVWEHNIARDRRKNVTSPANFLAWRDMNRSFEDVAAVGLTFPITLTGRGDPAEIPMQLVSAGFFPILGVAPALGRALAPEDDHPGSRVAVISDRLWRSRFEASRSIVGVPIALGGTPYTVVGVMPPGFSFRDPSVDLWLPIGFAAAARSAGGRWLAVVGRLRPGVSIAAAQTDMTQVQAELARQFPDRDGGWTAQVEPLGDDLTGEVRPALLVLAGAVAFVLLIACANVASLLLARATARRRELAVRAALGASRLRLVRQLFAESLVLAAAGGLAGLLLSWWAIRLLQASVAQRLGVQRLDLVSLDSRVLLFTAAVSLLSGLAFGVLPALVGTRAPARDLRDGGRSGSGAHGARLRSGFVVLETALAIVLLVGAGLLVRSFMRLTAVDPGFDPSRTLSFALSLPDARYDTDAARLAFFRRLFDHLDASPGVDGAGAVSFLPLTGPGSATGFRIVGRPAPAPGTEPTADVRVVTHDYFEAMRVPLLEGRLFDESRHEDAAGKVVVSAALARQYWPGQSAIGRRIRISWGTDPEDEIIGVVGDVHHADLGTEARATVYWPFERNVYDGMSVVVRTRGAVGPVLTDVRSFVAAADPLLAVSRVRTLDEVVAGSVARQQILTAVLGGFALAALALAAIGIYGVIAFSVEQRTREIGIRLALGAQRTQVLRQVVARAILLAGGGALLGGSAALALARLMTSLLYATTPTDAPTFAVMAGLLLGVAALAAYVPARRAARVDPVVALRAD